ncbi:TPA: hypothetical protein SMT48_000571 [Proteus mirabilis]|nr:hypothetical protein [Proteus mirabilis]NBN50861.1 hypothetical protein [Proteus sp. G4415]EKX5058675.1 hypothetical protein [Proteus mirabilis]MBG3078079.1 hypothetical protein [Proteus mirabilis]MBG3125313.1 hypothetical protein [Proteus mirabilis]
MNKEIFMDEKRLPIIKSLDLMKRNICPVCGKMDCQFLTKDKHCKEMMDLYHSGEYAKAHKIFMQRYAQFIGMQRFALKKAIDTFDSITHFTQGNYINKPIPSELNLAITSAQSTLIPGKTLNKATLAPVAVFTPTLTTASTTTAIETLGAILGRALGLGAGLMLYSPPVGEGSDRYPAMIYDEYPKNRETALTREGRVLNIPKETQLREIAKQKGMINTSAVIVEKGVNGAKQIELVKTETPVKTRVVEARKTAEKGVFAYTLPNEKQERKVQIGNATILKGIAPPQPKRHRYLPGKVYDISRFNELPLEAPTFFSENEKRQSILREPVILIFPWELGIKPIYLSTGKKDNSSEIKIEGKIQDQMGGRGWSEKDIQDVIAKGAKGKSVDQRRPKNTDDGLGRNDPATVYGEPGKYVVVNDRTGEVAQISNKNDPRWIDDSRIQWEKQ